MTTPVKFRISAPEPGTHFFHVEATIHGLADVAHVDVRLPVWTPGSYLVREYAQHVHGMRASGEDQRVRQARKEDKSTWRIDCRDTNSVMLSYDVYAHDLGVRNNHLDGSHGFVTPTATFVHPVGRLSDAVGLEVAPPEGWEVYCPLAREGRDYFEAEDFDALYDAPIEMGRDLESFEFEACGKVHQMVFWGRGNWSEERLARDLPKIVEANASIFGGDVPYKQYLTITLLTDSLYGGLEHRDSTALMYPRHKFESGKGSLDAPVTDEGYLDYLTLFAHEHFHAWHVKRIRPEVLGPFEYEKENYTRDIWTIEGITSYYQELAVLRAGIVKPETFLKTLAGRIHRLESLPGRRVRSLEEAGFDAWIRLYRPHESNLNVDINYYLKGQIVTMLLDILIRTETRGESSFDDVLRLLWQQYSGDKGYPEGGLETIIEEVTGVDMMEFFELYIRGTEDLNYSDVLEGIGLELKREYEDENPRPWIGVQSESKEGRCVVKSVSTEGPAAATMYPGDEIVAINGWKVDGANLEERLRLAGIGSVARVHVFRRDELVPSTVQVERKPHDKYTLIVRDNAPDEALEILEAWIGTRRLKDDENA